MAIADGTRREVEPSRTQHVAAEIGLLLVAGAVAALATTALLGIELALLRSSSAIAVALGYPLIVLHGAGIFLISLFSLLLARDQLRAIRGQEPVVLTRSEYKRARSGSVEKLSWLQRVLTIFFVANPVLPVLIYFSFQLFEYHESRLGDEHVQPALPWEGEGWHREIRRDQEELRMAYRSLLRYGGARWLHPA